ncbi:hypothetical protein LINPERPRIM_LOCUS34697 [Linum perenne]
MSCLCFVMLRLLLLSSPAVAASMSMLTTGVKGTIERYKKATSDPSTTDSVTETNVQYYQRESAKLRQQIGNLLNTNRQLTGILPRWQTTTTTTTVNIPHLDTLLENLWEGLMLRSSRTWRAN